MYNDKSKSNIAHNIAHPGARKRERVKTTAHPFGTSSVFAAYKACKKNKTTSESVRTFDAHCNKNLIVLKNELLSETYRPDVSICFIVTKPSAREVFAAEFRDRIVHHILVRAIEPRFERCFINNSYACRTGKGIHKALKDVRTHIRIITKNNTRPAFYIHLDVSGFFMSIKKDILFAILQKKVKNPRLRALASTILFHDPTTCFIYRGDPCLQKLIPPHKSLFCILKGQGLPIGNLTSQFFANVYLNELDQFVKHTLKVRHYFRYADDLLILAGTQEELPPLRDNIATFLKEHLALSLNEKKTKIGNTLEGIDWLGYIVHPSHVLVRKRIVQAAKQKIAMYEKILASSKEPPSDETRMHIAASINSYFGFFSHADTFALRTRIYEKDFKLLRTYLLPNSKKLISFTPMLTENKKQRSP